MPKPSASRLASKFLTLVEQGDRSGSMALLESPALLSGEWSGVGERAAMAAAALGLHDISLRLLDLGKAGRATLSDLLDVAACDGLLDSFMAFAARADRFAILGGAYRSYSSNGWEHCELSRWAMGAADASCRSAWERAAEAGLLDGWARRERRAYESACDSEAIPAWSASCAHPLGAGSSADPMEPTWAIHHSSALGLPSEVLLWGGMEFGFWREALARSGAAAGAIGELAAMESSHGLCSGLLPQINEAVFTARKGRGSKSLSAIARKLEAGAAAPWVPMLLAWSRHSGFLPSDERNLAPLLDIARIDERNVGMIAANLDYFSFNSRVALVCRSLLRRGAVSDRAAVALSARFDDLMADPTSHASAEPNEDLASCAAELRARAEAIAISRHASAAPGFHRKRPSL